MGLRITTTNALLGYWTDKPNLSIQQPRAEMIIEHTPARTEVNKQPLQIIIDQSDAFSEEGLKTPIDLSLDNSQRAKQIALQAMAEKAQEGDQLMHIENGGNAVADIAINRLPGWLDWNIGFMPTSRPKIDWQGGNLDIKVDSGGVNIKAIPHAPVINVEVGKVNFQMLQYNSINIEYLGNKIDNMI